ncbi:hypothetical protein CALCODRAFT_502444 [Calocera cornea HHB12733]|uniref:Formin GTPase-binding domain-containing protein n=1 Tax=Calocera cornea HHB12733 TaxID=1353952 RepID=A0A165D993_9BASI|nr:hypothetical protein CALCODRAFT_502444 [Calocera cornea HHB12733]
MPSAGKRDGKENRHERMQSASAVLTLQKDGSKTNGKTWTGPPPMLSKPGKEGKSSSLGAKAGTIDREKLVQLSEVQDAFDKMLDDLQIPESLRPRLTTLEPSVKAAMLRSSKTLDFLAATGPAPPAFTKSVRKVRSDDSLVPRTSTPMLSPKKRKAFESPPATPIRRGSKPPFEVMESSSSFAFVGADLTLASTKSSRPVSGDMPQFPSMSSLADLDDAPPKSVKSRLNSKEKALNTPSGLAGMLANTSATKVDVERVKKLRLLLRNEPASWTEEFLCHGGYVALLGRLKELLNVEWRDEQHDDQALYELLRCLKALSTSSIGSFALRSSCPTPFSSLVELMYSDKKPGDVPTRQLIVELYLILFELYPTRAAGWSGANSNPGTPTRRAANSLYPLPPSHDSLFSLLRSLLLTKPPPRAEAELFAPPPEEHEFIATLHTPRIYKNHLAELSDICRDYFWVFCHPGNAIWQLEEVDESVVERPRAPGGMTGGVEFEAMSYLTTHLRFINATAKAAIEQNLPSTSELSARRFHEDLFASGLERILAIIRKASATYYPTLHLEIARYIHLAIHARFELPWSLSRLVGSPPSPVRRAGITTPDRSGASGNGKSPGRRPQGGRPPILPATPRLDAIRM